MNHVHEILVQYPHELLVLSNILTVYAYCNGTYINFMSSLLTSICLLTNIWKHFSSLLTLTLLQIQTVLVIGSIGPHIFKCKYLNPTKIETPFGYMIFTFIANWLNWMIVVLFTYKNKTVQLSTSQLIETFIFVSTIIVILYLRNCLTVYECTDWAVIGTLFIQVMSNVFVSIIYFYLQ